MIEDPLSFTIEPENYAETVVKQNRQIAESFRLSVLAEIKKRNLTKDGNEIVRQLLGSGQGGVLGVINSEGRMFRQMMKTIPNSHPDAIGINVGGLSVFYALANGNKAKYKEEGDAFVRGVAGRMGFITQDDDPSASERIRMVTIPDELDQKPKYSVSIQDFQWLAGTPYLRGRQMFKDNRHPSLPYALSTFTTLDIEPDMVFIRRLRLPFLS